MEYLCHIFKIKANLVDKSTLPGLSNKRILYLERATKDDIGKHLKAIMKRQRHGYFGRDIGIQFLNQEEMN